VFFLIIFRLSLKAGAKVINSFVSGKAFEKFFGKIFFSTYSQFSYQFFK
jgi:hypothetical protein